MNKFILLMLAIFLQSCSNNLMSGFKNSNFSAASQENTDDYSTQQIN